MKGVKGKHNVCQGKWRQNIPNEEENHTLQGQTIVVKVIYYLTIFHSIQDFIVESDILTTKHLSTFSKASERSSLYKTGNIQEQAR
jgi:hypothetical protein